MFDISAEGMPKHRLVIFWNLTKISCHGYVGPQLSFVLLLFGHVNIYKLYKGCQEMWTDRSWDSLAKNTSGEQEIFIRSFVDYQGIQVNYRITILDKTKTCANSALKKQYKTHLLVKHWPSNLTRIHFTNYFQEVYFNIQLYFTFHRTHTLFYIFYTALLTF